MDIHKKLFKAVHSEDVTEVDLLLQAGADPNFYFQQDYGFDGTLLHYTQSGEIAEKLLQYGAHVDSRDRYGSTPLFHAVQEECVDVVKVLLNNGASLIALDGIGERVLNIAIRSYKGNMEIIKELIRRGANVNSDVSNPFPPLHVAVVYNKLDVIDELLRQGAHLEQRDDHHLTALHLALQIYAVKFSTIKKLLEVGADTNVENCFDQFPLDLAILHRDVDVVRELLKHGANIVPANEYQISSLFKAVSSHKPVNFDIVRELLKHGAKAGSYIKLPMEENSPTYYAVKKYRENKSAPSWVKLLIRYSTIEHLEKYDIFSTTELKSKLRELSDFAIICISEVSKMREEIIIKHRSLYDCLKEFVKNDLSTDYIDSNVANRIFNVLVKNDYVIYMDIIGSMINRDYLTQIIEEKTFYTYSQKSERIVLIPDTMYPIIRYLSNSDLLNLALAYHS